MSFVVLDVSMSINGQVAGPDGSKDVLHEWLFSPRADNIYVRRELLGCLGALVVGRRTYDSAVVHNLFGDDGPRVPTVVLTRQAGLSTEMPNVTYATEPAQALELAKFNAVEDEVVIYGGTRVADVFLSLGLVDSIRVHLSPMLLPGGSPFLDRLIAAFPLELVACEVTEQAIHLEYRPSPQ